MKTLSRGLACQHQNPDERCSGYAHVEFVDDPDVPAGRGLVLCHWHATEYAELHDITPSNEPCYECGEDKED